MKVNITFGKSLSSPRNTRALIVLAAVVLLTEVSIGSAQRVLNPSMLEQSAKIAGVKFEVPKDFRLEQSLNSSFAFMRHERDDLALFVTVPKNQQIDDQYLTNLSTGVGSRLLPQEQSYRWKVSRHSEPKISTRQTITATTKGFNNRTYVQCDLVIVKAQGQQVVLGSIFRSQSENGAGYLFDIEGHEYSFSGWKALFQLLASVTGEKFD